MLYNFMVGVVVGFIHAGWTIITASGIAMGKLNVFHCQARQYLLLYFLLSYQKTYLHSKTSS